jgi:hypothetical protein
MARLEEQRYAQRLRHQLAREAESLCRHFHGQGGDSRGVAARSIEARYEPQFDRRVRNQKVDRNGRGRGFGCDRCRGTGQRRNHRNSPADQILRQFRQPAVLSLAPAEFDRDRLSLHKAGFAQAFAESGQTFGVWLGRTGVQEPDDGHRRLLRTRRQRPRRCCPAEHGDELAPAYLSPCHSLRHGRACSGDPCLCRSNKERRG